MAKPKRKENTLIQTEEREKKQRKARRVIENKEENGNGKRGTKARESTYSRKRFTGGIHTNRRSRKGEKSS